MNRTAAFLSALIVLVASSSAIAGPVADAAARAEALQAQGKTVEALDALNEAEDAIWTAAPLAVRKVVLVDSSEGFGRLSERSDRVFRPDEEMRIYVEPVGFGYGSSSAGAAKIDFEFDLAIENMTGQVLGEAKDVFTFSTETYPERREFAMTLIVKAPYVRPGDYKALFTVRDRNSSKTGSFEVPFSIASPVAEGTAPGAEPAAPALGQAAPAAPPAPAAAPPEPAPATTEPAPATVTPPAQQPAPSGEAGSGGSAPPPSGEAAPGTTGSSSAPQ